MQENTPKHSEYKRMHFYIMEETVYKNKVIQIYGIWEK